MSTMGERISECVKESGLTKTAFGKRIGVSQSSISQLCSGDSYPRNGTIKNICREFGISEEWLRTGEGGMFAELSKNEALAAQIQKFLQGGTDSFRERLVSLLIRLPSEQWDTLEKYLLEHAAPREDTSARTDDDIERDVENFRQRRILEKNQEDASSPSSEDGTETA